MKNKKITLPPRGYRELVSDEIIIKGDLYYGSDPLNDPPKLHKSLSIGWTPGHSIHGYRYFRRKSVKERALKNN